MTDVHEDWVDDAMERDPRSAPIGIFTGGSFVLDSARVFCWFQSLDGLTDYLTQGMSTVYDFDEEYTAEYLERVQPLLDQIRQHGLTGELLASLNQAVKDDYVIDWWGNFDELVKNETEFAHGITDGFQDEGEQGRPVQDEDMEDFIDYLKTCAV
jgi:hypothetical protein